jgi:hypothetical protein
MPFENLISLARELERTFLSESVAGESGTAGILGDLYAHGGSLRSGNFGGAQNGKLREHLAVNLGDQVILTVGIVPPDLPELDGLDCHGFLKTTEWGWRESIAGKVPKVTKGKEECENAEGAE